MIKRPVFSLWRYFVGLVFLGMLLFALIVFIGILLVTKLGIWHPEQNPFGVIATLGVISIIIGTFITGFVGYRLLRPIELLRVNMSKVAAGDFTVHLEYDNQLKEVTQLYDDFNVMVKELNSIETLRDDFVSNVSHEFKTPLATIRGYVQLLQSNDLSAAERQDYLKRILDGTKQLTQLTENILKISKLENQGIKVEPTAFRLDEQIREVILFLQPKWEAANLELDLDLPRLSFAGNEELLYQVWLNLLDNAIKYNRENGNLKVNLTENEEAVTVTVIDNGLGMTRETLTHLFDKFYQGDTSRKSLGNGLGLPLAKQIIELHQGSIHYSSQLHFGTKVIVKLPKEKLK
jgi:signal transduction histidine kinase